MTPSALAALGAIAFGAPPGVADVLAPLKAHETVAADIVQTKHSRAFKRPQIASGKLILAGARKLRWEYTAPYKAVLVLSGDRVTMSYPDLGRKQTFDLSRDPAMKRVIDTILFFMRADQAAVIERFEVIEVTPGRIARVALRPRAESVRAIFATVRIEVHTQRGHLAAVEYTEPDGDRTRIAFEKVRVDQPVDEALLVP